MHNEINNSVPITHNGVTTNYFFSSKHRGAPTTDISVWNIGLDDELNCFSNSFENGWHNNGFAWGCIISNFNDLLILGENLRNAELKIAKFVTNQNQWHGYPADVRYKPRDKPLPNILLSWLAKGIISKSLMARIKQGQI